MPVSSSDHEARLAPALVAPAFQQLCKFGRAKRFPSLIEKRGDIEATEEHHPAHFHVVVIPAAYKEYLASR